MQHPVVSEEEMMTQPIKHLAPGPAQFRVVAAQEKVSKSGNPMIELKLEVTDKKQTIGNVFDYLVGIPQMAFKIKHFWTSVGLPEQYEAGETPPEVCLNQKGNCVLKMEKPRDPAYPPRIVIGDYVAREEGDLIDDDLPF